jgi:hypothetical protein
MPDSQSIRFIRGCARVGSGQETIAAQDYAARWEWMWRLMLNGPGLVG